MKKQFIKPQIFIPEVFREKKVLINDTEEKRFNTT